MDNPLLSYVDVRHANFLPPPLTVGETQDLSPKYTAAEDCALVRDETVEQSQSCTVHVPIEEQEAPAQPIEPEVIKAHQDDDMATRRKMTVDRFLPNTRPVAQP